MTDGVNAQLPSGLKCGLWIYLWTYEKWGTIFTGREITGDFYLARRDSVYIDK